jgi:hypothetical protein
MICLYPGARQCRLEATIEVVAVRSGFFRFYESETKVGKSTIQRWYVNSHLFDHKKQVRKNRQRKRKYPDIKNKIHDCFASCLFFITSEIFKTNYAEMDITYLNLL